MPAAMVDSAMVVRGETLTAVLIAVGSGVLLVLLLGWFVAVYNRLVRQRNQVAGAWAQIDVQLKRRHDLIPNLVESVRGYATHEQSTLRAVVEARGVAAAAAGPAERSAAEQALERDLGRLLAVAEQYPRLRADRNFLSLQDELATTENKIAYARQFYNGAVQTLNTTVQSIPTNLVAVMTRFHVADFFTAGAGEQAAVQVKF
jgi:LemA protein